MGRISSESLNPSKSLDCFEPQALESVSLFNCNYVIIVKTYGLGVLGSSIICLLGEDLSNIIADLVFTRTAPTHGLRILTYGTFDTLHFGHLRLLRRAADRGNYLVVGLSTDEFTRVKDKQAFFSFEKRLELLKALPYVDEIIPEISWEQKREDIQKYSIDVITMGSDWHGDPRFEELRNICKVIYLPYTFGISSSNIRQRLHDVSNDLVGSNQAIG